METRLEFVQGTSSKFWHIKQFGSDVAVTFGRIGTSGQLMIQSHASPAAALADAKKQVAAKLKKGYVAVPIPGAVTPAAPAKAPKRAAVPASAPADHPFLFIGQGFGTSYKCLECYAWFERIPSAAERKAITAKLPPPVRSFARFADDVLHFGSDDMLESRVIAAYDPKHAKTPFEEAAKAVFDIAAAKKFAADVFFPSTTLWKAFCADFEHAMIAIHAIVPLRLVVKPDDGEDKRTAWHRWSVDQSFRIAAWGLAAGDKPRSKLVELSINVLESLPEGASLRKRMPPEARLTWLRWLDRLMTKGPSDLRDELEDFVVAVVASFPANERDGIVGELSKPLQRVIAAAR